MFNHIIQELITKAIEKQAEKIITKKTFCIDRSV